MKQPFNRGKKNAENAVDKVRPTPKFMFFIRPVTEIDVFLFVLGCEFGG